ncbi:alternate-type signal peptide domain-containing protein [Gryllotalpicola ginsengisoli]|uniref:alternate-type signal peptide domain-containing protein n=1 Tax=Gryllotalpicola ginsengisoli TaxID=444608 RepID=UPI0003B3E46B|nr:alternate-type signal peptide domain-containing protein [Gryllotalpicola ginsengisoli]
MNKLIKGAVAGAAGIALLLGGAGTFALWNDSAAIGSGSTINSGSLKLGTPTGPDGTGSPTWTLKHAGSSETTTIASSDLASTLIVPGDTLEYVAAVPITALGKNLSAELSINSSDVTGSTFLKSALQYSLSASGTGVTKKSTNVYQVSNNLDGTQSVTVTVDIALPSEVGNAGTDGSYHGQDGQGETVNLNALKLTLTQTS